MLLAYRLQCSALLLTIVLACGCQTGPQSPFANSFLSADRVPPPATRTIAPGAAQPYYPGDPVPQLQGAVQGTVQGYVQGYVQGPHQGTFQQGAPPLATIPAMMPPTVPPAMLPTAVPTATYGPAQPQFVPITPAQFSVPAAQPVQSFVPPFASNQGPNQGVADTGFTNPASPAAATSRPPLGGASLAGSGFSGSGFSQNGFSQNGANAPNAWRSPGQQGFVAQPIGTAPRVRMPQSTVQPASYVAAVPGVPQTVGVTPLPFQQPQAPGTYQQSPAYNSGWQVPPRR